MSRQYKNFEPKWFSGDIPKNSYRSIFKWGDPLTTKAPCESFYALIKEVFSLNDEYFKEYHESLGLDEVEWDIPSTLSSEDIRYFEQVVEPEFVRADAHARLSAAYEKTPRDTIRLRKKEIGNVPDIVLYPDSAQQIQSIVSYCSKNSIPFYVCGGADSAKIEKQCVKGSVALDLKLRFNRVVAFNELDQTVTVEAGISGSRLEDILNHAVTELGAARAYTCGHFPLSFEYSSVAEWVTKKESGEKSAYYGTITDLVTIQEYATSTGSLLTGSPMPNNIGSLPLENEEDFGVLTHVTLTVFRHHPKQAARHFSYLFHNWETAQAAAREILQSEIGQPAVFRLTNPEETAVMLPSPLRPFLKPLGFQADSMCLLVGSAAGDKTFAKACIQSVRRICKKFKALAIARKIAAQWERERFSVLYLRDALHDFGIVTDTIEGFVPWSTLGKVYTDVRTFVKENFSKVICMTHISHSCSQGATLCWVFISQGGNLLEFDTFHAAILDTIQSSGGLLTHPDRMGKIQFLRPDDPATRS